MVSESGDAIWSQKKRIRGIQYGPPPKKKNQGYNIIYWKNNERSNMIRYAPLPSCCLDGYWAAVQLASRPLMGCLELVRGPLMGCLESLIGRRSLPQGR
jgi:hypothetical protein